MKKVRVKVASLKKLGFQHVAQNVLINKAEKDFWKVESKTEDGQTMILRVIDDDEFPVEG